jgi:hypothetical protein
MAFLKETISKARRNENDERRCRVFVSALSSQSLWLGHRLRFAPGSVVLRTTGHLSPQQLSLLFRSAATHLRRGRAKDHLVKRAPRLTPSALPVIRRAPSTDRWSGPCLSKLRTETCALMAHWTLDGGTAAIAHGGAASPRWASAASVGKCGSPVCNEAQQGPLPRTLSRLNVILHRRRRQGMDEPGRTSKLHIKTSHQNFT